jgi:hypothetical protein
MKKIISTTLLLLTVFSSFSTEKKTIEIRGVAKAASHEGNPSNGTFTDTYTCSPDDSKVCYSITIFIPGPDKNAPYLESGDVSNGDSISITAPDGNVINGIFRSYSWTADPNNPYLDRIHSIEYSTY